jgi:hypothetical protein
MDVAPWTAADESPAEKQPGELLGFALTSPVLPSSRPSLEPISADHWSMRVTIDAALKEDLETLKDLLSHKLPMGELSEVLREAVRCAIERHGKRRGAVKPARERKPAERKARPAGRREPVPAAVKAGHPRSRTRACDAGPIICFTQRRRSAASTWRGSGGTSGLGPERVKVLSPARAHSS